MKMLKREPDASDSLRHSPQTSAAILYLIIEQNKEKIQEDLNNYKKFFKSLNFPLVSVYTILEKNIHWNLLS